MDGTVFVITEDRAKNEHERIVPLNSVASRLVEGRRGNGSEFVFDYKGRQLDRINNRAWRRQLKNPA